MEIIENSDKRIVFEAKNYLVPSPKRPIFDFWSATRAEFTVLLVFALALLPALFLEKIFEGQTPKGGITTICFGLLCLICSPLMFWPDPARVRHRYTVVIDKGEGKLLWKRFGWRFGDPLIKISAIELKEIMESEVLVKNGLPYLNIYTDKGHDHLLDMPTIESAKSIQWHLEFTTRNL